MQACVYTRTRVKEIARAHARRAVVAADKALST